MNEFQRMTSEIQAHTSALGFKVAASPVDVHGAVGEIDNLLRVAHSLRQSLVGENVRRQKELGLR